MLIKLITNSIDDQEHFRCVLIMNSDSSATLTFFQILEFKSLNLLSFNLKLGDSDEINKHVAFKYKLISYNLQRSREKLNEVCSILKSKNPSLITQINKAAMISHPYQLRMSGGLNMINQSQNSARSIKSKAYSTVSRATIK